MSSGDSFAVRLGNSFQPSRSPRSRGLHTIRYGFEPDSVDKTKGSLIEDSKGEVTLAFANATQTTEEHLFKGKQSKGKDTEFLLFYDEETHEYVLEKLSSTLMMRNVRQPKRPHSGISNLEDAERPGASNIMGSATTAGLLKPPMEFKAPKVSKSAPLSSQGDDEDFAELENLLERDLSS